MIPTRYTDPEFEPRERPDAAECAENDPAWVAQLQAADPEGQQMIRDCFRQEFGHLTTPDDGIPF